MLGGIDASRPGDLLLVLSVVVPLLVAVSCSTTPFTDYDRAKSLSDAGQYQQAIVVYSRSINLLPNDADSYLGRGYAYEKLGEYQKALSDYSQVIALKPEDPQAYFVRGLLYDFLGKTDQAIQDYTTAISLKPNYADAYYEKAANLIGKASVDQKTGATITLPEAAVDLNKYLELAPNGPYADSAKALLTSLGAKVESGSGKTKAGSNPKN